MARSSIDLHNTADKSDELEPEKMDRLTSWWNETAQPLMEEHRSRSCEERTYEQK